MIRHADRLVARCALTLALAGFATFAQADWYSGDPYTAATAWPQYTDNNSLAVPNNTLAMTFDNFTWVPGSGGGVIDRVGGHFHAFAAATAGAPYDNAYWEIRTGMAHNVAGTLVASGGGPAVYSPTAFLQGGWGVWRMDVDVPNLALPAGNYWFGLAIGTSNNTLPGAFVASTSGTNGISGPLGDDVSIYYQINNAFVSWNYVDSAITNPTLAGFDPSYFINEVPEPATLWLAGLALLAVGPRLARP